MRNVLRAIARGAAMFCCLAAFVCPGAGTAAAAVTGSFHDWSATGPQAPAIPANGTCSFCHVPHAAAGARLWNGRTTGLVNETTFYEQVLDPNYIPAETLLCYDCHDDATTVDNDPDSGFWRNGRRPQDVALFGTNVGYYERIDGTLPIPGGPIDGSATGGHYWKSVPTGTNAPERGDKIRCSLCHDPHKARTGTNDVFFLTQTLVGNSSPVILGNGLKASPNVREFTVGGTGREMCAACHKYAEPASGIPESFWGVQVPRPLATLTQHSVNDTTTPCTSCHKHNKIVARCDDCHGNPPITAVPWAGPGSTGESYPGSAGAHLAHIKGAGKLVTDPDLYSFGCLGGACHPANTHNQGVNGAVVRANVQVAFKSPTNPAGDAWNPNGVFTPGASPPLDACTQLYCHSNALVENGLNPADNGSGQAGLSGRGEYAESAGLATFYGTTPAKPATWGGSLDCRGCHGKGAPNVVEELAGGTTSTPVSPPDYLNAGAAPVGPYNTTGANTHFLHVYKLPNSSGGTCNCHGNADPATRPAAHVNRQIEITSCVAVCHLGGNWGDKHGQLPAADNCTSNGTFGCHGKDRVFDSPGGRITRPANATNPQDNQLKYMQSGHGLPAGSNYASGNPGAGLGCEACHLATDRLATNGPLEASYHYERDPMATGNAGAALATNPYWLKAPYANNPDGLCDSCHAASSTARNHTAQNMWNFARYNPKYDNGSNPPPPVGSWTTFTPNCVSCHDPHGEPNWYMLYDGDAEKSVSSASPTMEYSGPVLYKGDRFGVTRAQSNQYGFPPGPPYAANQTPVAMTGDTSGSDFVNGGNTGICQVCHTQTTYYRRDGSNPGGAHIATLCTDCHKHPTAFAPTGCEGCHGKDCNVSTGLNGTPGNADDAPNVMTTSCPPGNPDGTPPPPPAGVSVWDGAWWDTTQGGNDATQQGGHGDPDGRPAVGCTDCHDIADPPGTHFDGTYNSLGTEIPMPQSPWFRAAARPKAAPNANTAHLVAAYGTAGAGTDYQKQVAMDQYCSDCHAAASSGVNEMRHERDTAPTDADHNSVRLGTHGTMASVAGTVMDSDLTTNAGGAPHYAPCSSCHNPHGSRNTDTKGGASPAAKNRMIIDNRNWQSNPPTLCTTCHQ